MKRVIVGVLLAAVLAFATACSSQMPSVKDAPMGVGATDLRVVAVDIDGNCYISRPKTIKGRDTQLGTVAGMGNFVFFGDCAALFRDGWE